MNNERTMLIATVAVVAVMLGTAAFLFFPRPSQSAQPIPVTGLSGSGGSQPDLQAAANSNANRQWESPIQEYIRNRNAREANTPGTAKWESPIQEYIRNLNAREANTPGAARWESPMQVTGEFCPFTADELQSLHAVYLKDINVHMLETKDGPIGYDGGAFALSQCRISK